MNGALSSPARPPASPPAPALALSPSRPAACDRPDFAPLLRADWRNFVLLHFALPPERLAPHVPYPLDLHDGRAFVSLVHFSLENLRPARGGARLGRALLRPVSDHWFLNVRTYLRQPGGDGICFLAEWINNPLSRLLGPLAYGLPYRLGRFRRDEMPDAGLLRVHVRDRATQKSLGFTVPRQADTAPARCTAGSLDEFLLERYVAHSFGARCGRWFRIQHQPWIAGRFDLARFDTSLLDAVFPWFRHAEFVGGHLSSGFAGVAMGAPHLCALAGARATAEALPDPRATRGVLSPGAAAGS